MKKVEKRATLLPPPMNIGASRREFLSPGKAVQRRQSRGSTQVTDTHFSLYLAAGGGGIARIFLREDATRVISVKGDVRGT